MQKFILFLWKRLLIPILILFYIASYLISSRDLHKVSVQYPYGLIAIMGILLTVTVVREVLLAAKEKELPVPQEVLITKIKNSIKQWRKQICYVVFTVAYLILIQLLGYYLSTIIYSIAMAWVLGVKKPLVLTLIGASTFAAIYLMMSYFLKLTLPSGILF